MDKLNYFQKFLKPIIDASGPSGFEGDIRRVIKNLVKSNNYFYDKLGSLIYNIPAKNNNRNKFKLSIDAHIDEIGFIISKIEKNGFLKIVPLGGWWSHVLLGKTLKILGNKKPIIGVVGSTPIHILPIIERNKLVNIDKMYIDIGASSDKEAINWGVYVGAPVVKNGECFMLNNSDYICGKALDNRLGTSVLVTILNEALKMDLPFDLFGVFAVQEEVGLRGAKTAAQTINPDISLVIDTTVSNDYPGAKNNDCKTNNGVGISILDRTILNNPKLRKYLISIAKSNNLKVSIDTLSAGGADGGAIQCVHNGVITATLSIPTRYLHTHNEIASINDIQTTISLITKFLEKLNYQEFIKLSSFE